jgi:long-subunit acyl-CoA synthetase (AMP-forming)
MVVLAETVRPKLGEPGVKEQITAELTQLLKDVNAGLPDYEKLQMIVINPEPWSIENGCLTPTMKIKRARIESNVTPKLDAWYASKEKVQWL